MKKLSLPAPLVATVGWMLLLAGPVLAHPGVEGVVVDSIEAQQIVPDDDENQDGGTERRSWDCEDCEDGDEARVRAAAAEDKQAVSKIKVSFGVRWTQPNGISEVGHGLIRFAHRLQNESEMIVCFRFIRLPPQEVLERRGRLIRTATCVIRHRESFRCFCILGGQAENRFEFRHRFFPLS